MCVKGETEIREVKQPAQHPTAQTAEPPGNPRPHLGPHSVASHIRQPLSTAGVKQRASGQPPACSPTSAGREEGPVCQGQGRQGGSRPTEAICCLGRFSAANAQGFFQTALLPCMLRGSPSGATGKEHTPGRLRWAAPPPAPTSCSFCPLCHHHHPQLFLCHRPPAWGAPRIPRVLEDVLRRETSAACRMKAKNAP